MEQSYLTLPLAWFGSLMKWSWQSFLAGLAVAAIAIITVLFLLYLMDYDVIEMTRRKLMLLVLDMASWASVLGAIFFDRLFFGSALVILVAIRAVVYVLIYRGKF